MNAVLISNFINASIPFHKGDQVTVVPCRYLANCFNITSASGKTLTSVPAKMLRIDEKIVAVEGGEKT